MITNSNRGGAIGTTPEGRSHKSGTDTRSGKESDGQSNNEDVSVIKPGSKVRIKVEDGRLKIVNRNEAAAS
jgi:hypothetical protein